MNRWLINWLIVRTQAIICTTTPTVLWKVVPIVFGKFELRCTIRLVNRHSFNRMVWGSWYQTTFNLRPFYFYILLVFDVSINFLRFRQFRPNLAPPHISQLDKINTLTLLKLLQYLLHLVPECLLLNLVLILAYTSHMVVPCMVVMLVIITLEKAVLRRLLLLWVFHGLECMMFAMVIEYCSSGDWLILWLLLHSRCSLLFIFLLWLIWDQDWFNFLLGLIQNLLSPLVNWITTIQHLPLTLCDILWVWCHHHTIICRFTLLFQILVKNTSFETWLLIPLLHLIEEHICVCDWIVLRKTGFSFMTHAGF